MLNLSETRRIFIRNCPTDMRLGYNGLESLVLKEFCEKPLSGHLFVFVNKAKNRMKILVFESGGYWLLCKRLEIGTFALKFGASGPLPLSRLTFLSLLDGVEILKSKKKKRYLPK